MKKQGRKEWMGQAKPHTPTRDGLPWGRLTLRMLFLGVVGKGRGLHEGHQAVLAHEGPVPGVQPQVILQRGVGCKLGPTLLTGEGLFVKMLSQLVILHSW